MDPQGAQTEPKNQQIETQGATENKEHAKLPTNGEWSRKCYNGVPRPPKIQEKHKKGIKSYNKARTWATKT